MEKKRNNGIIYDSSRDNLINQMYQLQRLQEEGISTSSLQQETHNKLMQLVEMDDKEKLRVLREELKEL